MQIIVLEMLDTVKFSIGLGIMFGLIGALTTSLGPLNGMKQIEPQRQETYIQTCVPSEDSDQPAHSCNLCLQPVI